ncbi:putative carboxylesterase 8 [Apostasia shenzhenica]|uniref:Putative carboxylesterase 8 n=1 Tax=Apostasia shenzhenica TaxID=1088818 RepID=A0A2I0AEP4_9ASPA|nr:putative carboxylesterase 8 [Apostasia shenzhenica]
MDPFSFLKISLNPDGSLTRHSGFPLSPPTGDHPPDSSVPVVSKDVTLNPSHNTWIRIFLPAGEKLPLIIYVHGGGFIFCSAASAPFHASCSRLAAALPAAVLSLDYRLAPEHRLPAAYDDAVESLLWASAQARDPSAADPWLRDRVDFSRCFIMGSSSGGNIAYRAAILAGGIDLKPMKLAGVILNQPYFGGEQRTESEVRMAEDRIVPLPANDLMWSLALPIGANRDHEFCNPAAKDEEDDQELKKLPAVLVRGYVGDPLIDRQREVARMLEKRGVKVVAMVEEEGHHAVELFDSGKASKLVEQVRDFVGGQNRL